MRLGRRGSGENRVTGYVSGQRGGLIAPIVGGSSRGCGMSVGALVVARLGSTRRPAKTLLDLLGRPMIERLIRRLRAARGLDLVAIATSSDPIDQPLADLGARLDVPVHRGDLHNVMERLRTAAAEFGCDTVVEVLGDNPLVHSDLVEAVLERFRQEDLD